MVPISDLAIKAARPGETLWDSSLKGFGIRIGKKSRTFIVLVESGRRKRIGRYPIISLAQARAEAKRILAEKALGKIHPTHKAYDDAKAEFLAECERLRPLTRALYRRHLTVHLPFGRKGLGDIAPRDILARLKGLKPSEKEHAFRTGRTFFRWCVAQHYLDRSPMERLEPPPSGKPRDRVLSEAELTAVYKTALGLKNGFERLVCLLIHTGQRQGELRRLEWQHIASDTITLPGELTKNGRTHAFPLGPRTKAMLEGFPRFKGNAYVLPSARTHVRGKPVAYLTGLSAAKRAFDQECGVRNWTLHDLRRTFATAHQKLGTRLEVIEALLNHVSGTRSGIVGVYQRYDFAPEMRKAMEAWENYLSALLV